MPRCRPAGGGPRQPVRGMSGRAARYFQRAHRACDEGRDGDSALGPRPRRRPNHQPLCSGAGEGRAVCTRLAIPLRACRVRSLRGGGRSSHVIRIPSDSRHLLGLWQVLLRRGKQIFGAGATVGRSATGSAPKSPMPQDPSPLPFPAGAPGSAHNGQAFGHPCKRPFTDALLICKKAPFRELPNSCRPNCRKPSRQAV